MRRKDREVTNSVEIQKILDTCKVCRLGLAGEDEVYIVPMNHGYTFENGKLVLYFHGAREGRKIEMIQKNPQVGFEMDCNHELEEGKLACQYSYIYASVLGSGKAEIIDDSDQKLCALSVIMKHQTGKEFEEFQTNPRLEKAVAIIRVEVNEYTCKKHMRD